MTSRLATVGILGQPGSVRRSGFDAEGAMHEVGMNTGNLMFQYSCAENIVNPRVHFELWSADVKMLRETIDVLVIPAANQLNPAWDLKWWAKLIEDLDKPVVIAGLGAQAKVGEVAEIMLQPGSRRFVDLLKERAAVVGVRGERTRDLLHSLGVENVEVTGCPSNFIVDEVSGAAIQQRIDRLAGISSPSVNFLPGTLEPYTRECEAALWRLTSPHLSKVIYQTNPLMLDFSVEKRTTAEGRKYLRWEAGTLGVSFEEYRNTLRRRAKFYFSAPAWIDDVSTDDLTIGQRIHGAVAAIQGGSLGVCVAFDSRTLELSQTMGYPYLLADEVPEIKEIATLGQHVRFDADDFDRKRATLRSSLKSTLEQFGVVTRL